MIQKLALKIAHPLDFDTNPEHSQVGPSNFDTGQLTSTGPVNTFSGPVDLRKPVLEMHFSDCRAVLGNGPF